MREGDGVSKESPILGDVVISTEAAYKEARKRKTLVENEIYLYIVHGILHLLGYDDEKSSDRKKMQRREKNLLESRERTKVSRKF